jgi:tetratricopeptide (TPR) repeat protein
MMLRDLSRREPPEQFVKLVLEETQGNAFFIEELYKHLAEENNLFDSSGHFRDDIRLSEIEVPDNVRLVVSRRLERLGPSTKHVLTAAAVIGRSFSFKLLEALLSETDIDDVLTSIEDAQRMGLIISSSEGPEAPFRFSHEIVRQTLLADASLPRRQRLHLRVADALEKIDVSVIKDRTAEIALHLVQAGSAADRQRTRDFLTLAGRVAVEAGGYETALTHFESALSRVDENDLHQRGELLYSMAIAERGLGRWDNAHLRWDEALGIFTAQDDGEAIAKVCFRIAQSLTWAGRWREAGEIAARCLTRLEGAISADRALLLAALGLSKAVEGDYQSAQEAFKMSLALSEELSDRGLKGAILAFRLQFNFFFLRLREALEDAYESAELLAAGSGPWPRAQRLCWMQTSLYHLGRVQEAAKAGEELQPLATRIGHVGALSYCRRLEAWTNFGKQPDLIQLANKLQKDLDANMAAGLDVLVALSHAQLSVAEFFRGNWDNALEHAEAACRPQTPHVMRALNIGILFRQQAYAGDRDSALALIRQHSEKLAHAGKANAYGSWAMPLLLTEGFVVLGEYQQAAALYPLVRELIATGTACVAFISRFPQTIAGVAAAAAQQWNVAEQHFRIALRQAQDFPHVVEVAEIQRFYGAMLIERDEPNDCGKARALLIQACDTYSQTGMPRHSAMAKALLNKLAPA